MHPSVTLIRKTLLTSTLASFLVCQPALAEKHSETKQHGAHEHGVARLTVATTDHGMEITLESPAANLFGFEYQPSDKAEKKKVHNAIETLEDGGALFYATKSAGCKQEAVEIDSSIVAAHRAEHKHDDDHKDAHDKHDDDHKDAHDKHDDDHKDAHDKHDDDHKDAHDKHDDDHKDAHDKHDDDHKDAHDKHDDDHKDAHDKHDDDHKDAHDKHDDDHKDAHDSLDDHDHKSGETHSDVDVTWNFKCDKPAELERVDVRLFSAFPKGFNQLDVDWISNKHSGSVDLEGDGIILLKP